MPTPTKGARLGGSAAHQRIILANLATQLFEHGKITTTEAKAKRLRPLAEKLITKAKRGDIHSRRLVLTTVRDKGVVHTLFTEIAPTFADREGGYTRITKVGPRKGDNAPMALIELVTESVADSKSANNKAAPAKKTAGRPSGGTSAVAAPVGDTTEAGVATDVQPVSAATPAGQPAGEQAPDDQTRVDERQLEGASPAAPAEADQLVGETAVEQETPSEEVASDDTSAEEIAELEVDTDEPQNKG